MKWQKVTSFNFVSDVLTCEKKRKEQKKNIKHKRNRISMQAQRSLGSQTSRFVLLSVALKNSGHGQRACVKTRRGAIYAFITRTNTSSDLSLTWLHWQAARRGIPLLYALASRKSGKSLGRKALVAGTILENLGPLGLRGKSPSGNLRSDRMGAWHTIGAS